ncbi:Mitochondrial inner membrane protein COX18 [Hypsizygus marmoreus]|uniref:Mitochondrial inner membrane protein COX18 n=1 Tax=Hypsizygus marmoreus TaxID=39966 RepID=A0A369JU28_HYPMA|nr:Mitochondrial inner membrane protein COX18 [Hypsizygus marmoreus]
MLALRRAPLRLRPHSSCSRPLGSHPDQAFGNRRYFIQDLCNGFLDLAIALPIPPSLPAYSTTIILTTVIARFAVLPFAIWGKRRAWRIEERVLPEIERLKPIVSKEVLEQMKKDGIRGEKKFLQETHAKRCIEILTARRKELFKEHKCRPLPSIIVPPLAQLPIFVIGTIMLGRLSLDPTPFDTESFLTLTTLAHPDPTMTLPIILGIITMANVESSNWVMNAAERERARQIEERNAKRIAESGQKQIQPKGLIKPGLRLLSIGRIMIAAITPGSIALYWVTSATFGLLQTWVMDWLDIRRRRRIEASKMVEIPATAATPPPVEPTIPQTRSKKRR